MGTYCKIVITKKTLYNKEFQDELIKWINNNLMEAEPSSENSFIETSVRKFKRRNHSHGDQQKMLAEKLQKMYDEYGRKTWNEFNPQVFVRHEAQDRFYQWDWKDELS